MLVSLIDSEEKIFEFKTFNILDDEFPEDHLECDGWIITGSKHGVYEELSWIKRLSKLINDIYDDFINLVSKRRKIEANTIKNKIGALIYNSRHAKNNYLIDGEINLNSLINKIIEKMIIKNPKQWIWSHNRWK